MKAGIIAFVSLLFLSVCRQHIRHEDQADSEQSHLLCIRSSCLHGRCINGRCQFYWSPFIHSIFTHSTASPLWSPAGALRSFCCVFYQLRKKGFIIKWWLRKLELYSPPARNTRVCSYKGIRCYRTKRIRWNTDDQTNEFSSEMALGFIGANSKAQPEDSLSKVPFVGELEFSCNFSHVEMTIC